MSRPSLLIGIAVAAVVVVAIAVMVAAPALWLVSARMSGPSSGRGWPSGICDTPGCWHG